MLDPYLALMAPGEYVPTLDELLQRPAWMADAACREHPELSWFPERGERLDAIRAVCRGCLVHDECETFAFEQDVSLDGVWAGISARERRRLRARRAAA